MEDQRGVVIDDATRTILLVGGQRAAADPAEAGKADRPIRKRLRDPLLHVFSTSAVPGPPWQAPSRPRLRTRRRPKRSGAHGISMVPSEAEPRKRKEALQQERIGDVDQERAGERHQQEGQW